MTKESDERPAAAGGTDDPDRGVRYTIWVTGLVQGVGFRYFTRTQALELGLVGSATNRADGRVEIVVEGSQNRCADLVTRLRGRRTPGRVDDVVWRESPARGGLSGFVER